VLDWLIDRLGDGSTLFLGGLMVGLIFGAAAQHSRFCLRAATVEIHDLRPGPRMGVWLVVFFAAIAFVQGAVGLGLLDTSTARPIAATGSLSGTMLGGLMFGGGMILARGCASRLLVLSATGNLRALITGLLLTIVAQASLRGGLAPAREALAGLLTIPGGPARDLGALFGLGPSEVMIGAGAILLLALLTAWRLGVGRKQCIAALGVGLAVALGWVFTYAMTQVSFEPLEASSVTFTGPSADTLMGLINERSMPMGFGIGLVPGVFAGSALMALATREWRLQGFDGGPSMLRYFAGAALMGFGAMLAGGCAVGTGVSGGAILALTSWLALASMWIGALGTEAVLSRTGPPHQAALSANRA